MFVGLQFCGDDNSISMTTTTTDDITQIQVTNGIYDEMFASVNADIELNDSSKVWNFDTRFYAKFQNNLIAGNIDYTSSTVSAVRIKRRKSNEHTWFTLYEIPIETNQDFVFELIDRYAQGDQEYYYALIPVIEGIEGNVNKNSILSTFKNYFILDKDVQYPIIFNTNLNMQINKPIGVINTLGKTYPFVISNGSSYYKTGTLQFSLVPFNDCEFDFSDGYNYREQFERWVMNGNPKIIKDWTGQIYMIDITSGIPIDFSQYDLPSYEIQFTEIGNPLSRDDMYNNNFIDVNFLVSLS